MKVEILQSKDKNFYMDVSMKFSILILLLLSSQVWAKWSVSTYNIRNFDNDSREGKTDIYELSQIIKEYKSDVMAFVEVVNAGAFSTLMKSNLPEHAYTLSKCGGNGKQRLALAYNEKMFEMVSEVEDLSFSGSSGKCDSLRPLYLVTLRHKTSKQIYTFGVAHLKAGGGYSAMGRRWEQYKQLEKLAYSYSAKNLILLGDFNTTGYNLKDQDYDKFEQTLSASSLRTTSESIGCTSYWSGNGGSGKEYVSSILDHIVLQDKSMASVSTVEVGAHCAKMDCRDAKPKDLGKSFEKVSDHCPIQVTFK